MSDRFQYPCTPPHSNHRWNLDDICIHCGKPKVQGRARVKEWRSQQIMSKPEKPERRSAKPKLTWDSVRVRRAVHAMKK